MKNYTKPMVNVVELTVKESLSALPNGLKVDKIVAAQNVNIVATLGSFAKPSRVYTKSE